CSSPAALRLPFTSPEERLMRITSLSIVEPLEARQLLTTYTFTDLGTLGGLTSRPLDINDAGDVVGYSTDAGGNTRAFLYRAGVMNDLGTLGGATAQATRINNHGQIIGTSSP